MTTDQPGITGDTRTWQERGWPRFESTWDPSRKEWNLLCRGPYLNLRLGLTQCALWVGGRTRTIFNRFPNLTGQAT